jgi:hypothetical protein
MVRDCRVAPARALNPRIPERLDSVVMKSLARDAEDRYQDGAEMGRDLERVLHEWQAPSTGEIARFLEVLFDDAERGATHVEEGGDDDSGDMEIEFDGSSPSEEDD